MTAQQFADMHQVWCAWNKSGYGYWFARCPHVEHGIWVGGEFIYGYLPPDIERPDGSWEQTLVSPKPDASKLVVDQPIMVRNNAGQEWRKRYFAKYETGHVFAFTEGATSWSTDYGDTGWYEWRLPTQEEMGRKE